MIGELYIPPPDRRWHIEHGSNLWCNRVFANRPLQPDDHAVLLVLAILPGNYPSAPSYAVGLLLGRRVTFWPKLIEILRPV